MSWTKSWVVTSLVTAVAAVGLVAVACSLPTWYAVLLLIIGVGVFLYMMMRNPQLRYWRLANFSLVALIAAHALPSITVRFLWGQGHFGELLLDNTSGIAFDLILGLVILVSLIMDYRSTHESGVTRRFVSWIAVSYRRQIQTAGNGPKNQLAFGDVFGHNNQININQSHGPSAEEFKDLLSEFKNGYTTPIERIPDVHAEIERACELLALGKADTAEKTLTDLKQRYWDKLTAREKYRLLANLGRTKEALGQVTHAIEYYQQAVDHQPEDNDARALGAIAKFLSGDVEGAQQLAGSILLNTPRSALAAAVWIRSAPDSLAFGEILSSIPEEVRHAGEVTAALTLRAGQANLPDEAEKYAREAIERSPNNPNLMESLGTAILIREAASFDPRNRPPDLAESPRLREAYDLLSNALSVANCPADRARIRFRRGQLNDLLDRAHEAETDFRVALENTPDDHTIARQLASFFYTQDQPDQAISILREVGRSSEDVMSSLFLATLLGDSGSPSSRREAADVLRRAILLATNCPPSTRAELVGLLVHNLAQIGEEAQIERVFADMPPEFLTRVSEFAARSEANHLLGHSEIANEQAGKALLALENAGSPYEQRMVADVLTRLHRFSEALPIWKKIISPGEISPGAQSALDCAWKTEDYEFFLFCGEKLRTRGIWNANCIEREILILLRYHDYDQASALAFGFIQQAKDPFQAKVMRVHLARIGIESNRLELVSSDPNDYPSPETAQPEVGLAVAEILKKVKKSDESMRYAYELLRRNYSSHVAHYAFIQAMGLADGQSKPLETAESVRPGYAVKYAETGGASETWCVIEDSPSPEIARNEFAPDHPLSQAMLRKRIGDTFTLRKDHLQDRKAKITGILNKYEFRKMDCLSHWEERFPEHPLARLYRLEKGSDGEIDLGLIFRSIDLHFERREGLQALYREYPISVLGFALLNEVTVAESLQHLVGNEDLPVRCCVGTGEELKAALDVLGNSTKIVIDPSALATLFLTGVFRILPPLQTSIITSEGVMQEYRTILDKLSERPIGFLTKIQGRHVMVPANPEENERYQQGLTEFLEWLSRTAQIEGGTVLVTLQKDTRDQAVEEFGLAAAECLALAIREGAVLWTDDIVLAAYAFGKHGIQRTWTQAVAIYLQRAGILGKAELDDITLKLVEGGYTFTHLAIENIFYAIKKADWNETNQPFRAVAHWLADEQINPAHSTKLIAITLPLIWREAPLIGQKEAATLGLIRSLMRRPRGVAHVNNLQSLVTSAFGVDSLNADRCQRFIQEIVSGSRSDQRIISA